MSPVEKARLQHLLSKVFPSRHTNHSRTPESRHHNEIRVKSTFVARLVREELPPQPRRDKRHHLDKAEESPGCFSEEKKPARWSFSRCEHTRKGAEEFTDVPADTLDIRVNALNLRQHGRKGQHTIVNSTDRRI